MVTNESDVEVTDLRGIVLYFDSENIMIAAGEEVLRVHHSYPDIMKPGVSVSMMFTPHNYRTIKRAGYEYTDYSFNGGRSDEFVIWDRDTVIYGFAWDSRWLRDKETESFRPMKKYDRADIYILED